MLKNKLVLILLSSLLLAACAAGPEPRTQPSTIQAAPSHVQRAKTNFHQGENLFLIGELGSSRYHFDRAINLLLDSHPPGHTRNPLLVEYIHRISEIELTYLHDSAVENLEKQDSFLEKAIATPLFKPTQKEITQLQKRVDQTPKISFPMVVNSKVASFLKAFTTVRRENIQNALNRSHEYIQIYKELFREHGLPEDLAFLPIIESGYRLRALSRARARGVWQFMAATARMFGLRVDWVVDERLDPFKSALAAVKYLKTLYKDYGDWYLALACYNGGTRRVDRAIRRLRTRDFFKLARTRYLRRETRNYVPAFLASIIIARSPEEYGFYSQGEPSLFVNTQWIELPSPVDLAQISRLSGVPVTRIKSLNPEMIRDFTPFNRQTYRMRFPSEVSDEWVDQVKRLPPEKKYFVGWYRVKKGDNLYGIARRFGTTVSKIKRVNKLKSNMIHPGDRLLIPRG